MKIKGRHRNRVYVDFLFKFTTSYLIKKIDDDII